MSFMAILGEGDSTCKQGSNAACRFRDECALLPGMGRILNMGKRGIAAPDYAVYSPLRRAAIEKMGS